MWAIADWDIVAPMWAIADCDLVAPMWVIADCDLVADLSPCCRSWNFAKHLRLVLTFYVKCS